MIEEGAILNLYHAHFQTVTQLEIAPSILHHLPSFSILDFMAPNATTNRA